MMKTIQIRLEPEKLKLIDKLVKAGLFKSRGEAIRFAVNRLCDDI